ncbi:hypothetical protein PV761_06095 [Arthrobacter sp. CC3]|uniref:hypothetical protein n=1 Tax=Arthrobacter sp. CC3 TaxID=3029185 RepID=UPI0032655BBE
MSEASKREVIATPLLNYPEAAAHQAARIDTLDSDIEDEKKKVEEAEAEASQAGRVELSLTGNENERRTVIGTSAELTDYLDGRHLESAEFVAPSGRIRNHSITLRAGRSNGLYARLSSNDAKWCIAGFSEIADEVAKQMPRWRFIRSGYFLYPLYLLSGGIALWFLGDGLGFYPSEGGKFTSAGSTNVGLVFLIGLPGLAYWAMHFTQKAIPAFQIVPLGKQHPGRAVITVLGGSLGTIALGILVNVLSKPFVG